ncbi:MAG TPA: hotdog domain-containing protein [Pirellulales bacterium]|nr:hotdog domain-containing protein [Pirellulales bacterium]
MKDTLHVGARGEASQRVVSAQLVSHYDPAGPPVFGSPFMLMLMEYAAFNALLPHLDAGEQSVGVGFEFEHLAATPAGAMVVAHAEVLEIDGQRVTFAIDAHDEQEIIGRGKHVRHVVAMERFLKRLRRKMNR